MTEYSKQTSFWNLLKNEMIVIPIIQRDYAQGRIGKEYLRERFLKQLFEALQTGNRLVLDFVYGSYENQCLYPLDGQQRLTTLWLLHWYLALCAGSLKEDRKILEKFSYTTRVSSRTFCEKLCSIESKYIPKPKDENQSEASIVTFIKDQHWFHSVYEQDPTIQSMLRMLGGTTKTDKDGNDIVDSIEEIYLNLSKEEIFATHLSLLKSNNSPIQFYLLNMEDKNMPLSDDLYIKMNARGKVLTDFENFKVDLLNYRNDDDTSLIDSNGNVEDSFSHLLDTKWTDVFWHYRSQDYKIDEIFFEFLNRFFLNWFIAHTEDNEKPESVTGSIFYKALTDKNPSGYKNISIYEQVLTKDCIDSLYTCLNNLYNLHILIENQGKTNIAERVNNLFVSQWSDKKGMGAFYFIPKYLDNGTITSVTVQQRVATQAVFVYLQNCSEVKIDTLKTWMHFVWNILENSYVDREQSVSAIRFFDRTLQEISSSNTINKEDDIIAYLASLDENNLPLEIFGRRQLKEEIIKAKKSLESEEWKNKIEEAEKLYFFKGAISFLFNDADGNPTDWKHFDDKLERAKTIFDENGLKSEYIVDTLQCLYSYCDSWENQLWWNHKIFNGLASTWKDNILTFVDRSYTYVYASPVHHILMGDKPNEVIEDERIRTLSNRSMIEYVLEKNENRRDMYIRLPLDALYFCGDKQGVLLSKIDRDTTISHMLEDERFTLKHGIRIPNTDKFWGFDIDLSFQIEPEKNIYFRWYRESNNNTYDIYLLDEQLEYKKRIQEQPNEKGDRKNYYCFNTIEGDVSAVVEDIIFKLKKRVADIQAEEIEE